MIVIYTYILLLFYGLTILYSGASKELLLSFLMILPLFGRVLGWF